MAGIFRGSRLFNLAAAVAIPISLLSVAPLAHGQSQSINGSIRGLVTDAAGAPVADASVTIKNVDTGYTREVKTDGAGLYVAPALPIGTYSVTSTSSGFSPLTQTGIHLTAGTDATVDEHLALGTVATEVEVTSDAPIVEAARFDLGRTITTEETQNLPLPSRNPYNFILFQPGVSGHPNAENGIPRTVNTNGLVDRVSYQLDGMVDTETDRYGLRLFAISDSYVREVQTISNSFAPEFGNTAGIIYNVISNSGTNQLHGEAQYFWRPKAASSCPLLQNCDTSVPGGKIKPDLHVDDYVGNLGGPIIKNKFFLFGAYEHLKRANPQANTVNLATQNLLETAGVSASDFNTAPQVQRTQWVDVRGDFNINSKNTAMIRYNYFRNNYPFNTNVGGMYAISSASDFQDRAHIIGAQLITTFTPNLLNEFRASIPYRNEHHVPNALTGPGPAIFIAAVPATLTTPSYSAAVFGGPAVGGSGDKYQEKIPSFNDNVTLVRGAHNIKVGFGFQKNNDTQLSPIFTQYNFASVQQYMRAKSGAMPTVYSSVTASIGQPGAGYQSVFFDIFAQDTWQVSRKLLVNYGVRYDQYRAPTPPANEPFSYSQSFRTPKTNFAPRLGIAYSPNPTTVVRLNGGIFYEATPTNTWYNPLYNNGAAGTGSFIATVNGQSLPPVTNPPTPIVANPCVPSFPNTPQQVPANCQGTQSITTLTPNFKNEYVWNANAQVQQQLAPNDSLTIGYTLTNGRNFQFLRNLNLINPTSFLADGRPVFSNTISVNTRLDPRFNNITLIDTGSNTSYNALTATYEHRLSAGLTTSASYTWSHSISDTPEANSYEFSTPIEDPTNRKRDRGNSGVNRPNAFTVSAVYTPKTTFENRYINGIFTNNTLALLGNFTSGDEQNITVSQRLNNDSIAPSRPLFVGRNTVRAPLIAQADLRYTRTFATIHERFSPKLLIEGTNLLNHTNVTTINTTATVVTSASDPQGRPIGTIIANPSLAPVSTVLEARILQFGLRVDF
jgi:hypothetical protein